MTTERKIDGTFERVPGGFARQLDSETRVFVPSMCVSRFDEETGTLYGFAPDYEAMEKLKAPATVANAPGEYSYYYESEQPPAGCDFQASLSYYGKHYFLRPLRDNLPKLHGRGITYNEDSRNYYVTAKAYEKIKAEYRISFEMCFD